MVSIRVLLVLSVILAGPLSTIADLHRTKEILRSADISALYLSNTSDKASPTVYFEVTKPIEVPERKPPCSQTVLHHDFGLTYGRPAVLANYTPPSQCPYQKFSKIVLEWRATCRGRQFDRIFGVWLNGVELLRSCTAEPRPNGILWRVEKDVTRYYNLLVKKETQTLAVFLGNLVDKTYTGVYHVDIIFHYYPTEEKGLPRPERIPGNSVTGYDSHADLILPISRNLPLNDGLWFEIQNSTAIETKQFKIPRNVYRASLEVYVSFHENDEFWYGNLPNDFILANNLSSPGNGPFREVLVSLDGKIIGAVWPFTVVFTGGINPLLWRPITAIGSFDLPTYDIEVTPFLGSILDGKTHRLGFSVANALNVWYIDANLHLWLDAESSKVEAKLLKHKAPPLSFSHESDFKGLQGRFSTKANRSISSTGWVKSSQGKITIHATQGFSYNNSMVVAKGGNFQIVDQLILINRGVHAEKHPGDIYTMKSFQRFPFYMYADAVDQGKGAELLVSNVTLGLNKNGSESSGSWFDLRNSQDGQGVITVKNNLVTSGIGSTRQVYWYQGSDACYFRNISSSNYTLLYDEVQEDCKGTKPRHGFRQGRLFSAARSI